MKSFVASTLRKLRDQIAQRGLHLRTVRGREHWRAGIEVLWRPFDDRTERAFVSHVRKFGEESIFLVRDPNDYIQSHFLAGNYYAEDELKIIQQYYKGGTFVDVGANIGNHSVFAAVVLKAPKVLAVEPYPEAYRILRCNIALNDLASTITHLPMALSSTRGLGSLQSLQGNIGLTVLSESSGNVPIELGDEVFASQDVGFLKIDVEGLEMKVLNGLRETLARCRPPAMIEVDDENTEEFFSFCRDLDYIIVDKRSPYRANTYYMITPN